MSGAEGVPLTRELLEALVEAAGMQSDMALPNVNLANVWYAVKQKCAAALASDAGTGEKCPFCDSSPCEGLDECRSYTATCHRQAQANPPTSGAAPEERDGELSRLLWRFCEQAQPLGRPDLIEIALDAIHAHVAQVKREAREELVAQKDGAYRERDMCVALLAQLASQLGYPVGMARHEGEWEDDWRWIVYIELPAGQVSWHIHDSERHWFDAAAYRGKWDGHSTDEKYRRVLSVKNRAPAPARGDASGEMAEARFKLALVAYGDDPSEQRRFAEVLRLYRAATGEVVGTGVTVGGVFQTPADGPSSVTVYLDPPIRVIGPETRVSLVRRRGKEGV